jgi:hypothetical protein
MNTSPCPTNFTPSIVRVEGVTVQSKKIIWDWLSRKETFTKGQIPPYRVEFFDHDDPFFHKGTYNNHHGPFLHLPAYVTEMEEEKFREMRYLYGSYVLGFGIIRPTALIVLLEEVDEHQTKVVIELHAHVRPIIRRMWESVNRFFWNRFFFPYLHRISS